MIKKIAFFTALYLCTTACTDKEGITNPNQSTVVTTTSQTNTARFIKNNTINLRLRETPDLEGAIIAVLDKDIILDYANDSTKFTTAVIHNNVSHDAHWYKVKLVNKEEGWVYGALVSFLTDSENQKILNKRKKTLKNTSNEAEKQGEPAKQKIISQKKIINQEVINQYNLFMDKNPTSNPESISKTMRYFEQRIAGKQNTATCDAAFTIFYRRLDELLKNYQQKNFTNITAIVKQQLLQQGSVNMSINATTQLMAKNALTFDLENTKVVISPDFDKLNRLFYKECSSVMQKYLDLAEQTQRMLRKEDALLTGQNLVEWHSFVLNNTDFVWSFKAKKALNKTLNQFLQAPAFDSNSQLKNSYLNTYKKMAKDYASTPLGTALSTYIQLLEDNDFKINARCNDQRSVIYKTIMIN